MAKKKKPSEEVERIKISELLKTRERVRGASGKSILDYVAAQKGEAVTARGIHTALKIPIQTVRARLSSFKKSGKIKSYIREGELKAFYWLE